MLVSSQVDEALVEETVPLGRMAVAFSTNLPEAKAFG